MSDKKIITLTPGQQRILLLINDSNCVCFRTQKLARHRSYFKDLIRPLIKAGFVRGYLRKIDKSRYFSKWYELTTQGEVLAKLLRKLQA